MLAKQKVRRAAHMVVLKKSGARVKVLISGQDVQGCRKGLGCRSLAIIVAFFFKKSLESGMIDCRFFLGCRSLAVIAACLFFYSHSTGNGRVTYFWSQQLPLEFDNMQS